MATLGDLRTGSRAGWAAAGQGQGSAPHPHEGSLWRDRTIPMLDRGAGAAVGH